MVLVVYIGPLYGNRSGLPLHFDQGRLRIATGFGYHHGQPPKGQLFYVMYQV